MITVAIALYLCLAALIVTGVVVSAYFLFSPPEKLRLHPSNQARAEWAAFKVTPLRYFTGDIELRVPETIIFDCAGLVYAQRLGLDQRFGIKIITEPPELQSDLYLISRGERYLSRATEPEDLRQGKLKGALVPRAAYSGNQLVEKNSTDIYVTSTFVGSTLMSNDPKLENQLQKVNGAVSQLLPTSFCPRTYC